MCGTCNRVALFNQKTEAQYISNDTTERFGPDLNRDVDDSDHVFDRLTKLTEDELAEIEAIVNSMRIL